MSDTAEPTAVNVTERIVLGVAAAKEQWLARMMKEILPPDLLAIAAKSERKAWARKKLAHWCEVNLVAVQERSDCTELWKGPNLVCAFRVRVVDGKLIPEEHRPKQPCQPPDKPS